MYNELTEVDIKKMQEEINYRVRELRPQLIEEVQTARAFGAHAAANPAAPDSVGRSWYDSEYEVLYGRLTAAIKNYMTSTQSSLAPRAEQMKKNAYRAVTPVLISVAVMIAIVLMLYYFMSVYCVNPIIRMNKGLGDWLSFRVPFAVKGDLKDEVLELKEKIESLINISKQTKS